MADFTEPFHSVSISMVMRRTPGSVLAPFKLLRPLSTFVWLVMLAIFLVVSMAMYIVDHVTASSSKCELGGMESLWIVFSILILRNGECKNQSISIKILQGSLWFCALLLILCYSANLTAFFTTTSIGNKIYTVNDLIGQTSARFGTVRNSHISAFFQNSKVPTYQRIWHAMSSFNNSWMVSTVNEGVNRVRANSQDYAFLWNAAELQLKLLDDCVIDVVDQIHRISDYAFVVPQGAPYKEGISMAILRLKENGKLQELQRRYHLF